MPPRFGRFAPKKSKRKIRSSKPRRTALGIQPGAAQVHASSTAKAYFPLAFKPPAPREPPPLPSPFASRSKCASLVATSVSTLRCVLRCDTSASRIVISPDAPPRLLFATYWSMLSIVKSRRARTCLPLTNAFVATGVALALLSWWSLGRGTYVRSGLLWKEDGANKTVSVSARAWSSLARLPLVLASKRPREGIDDGERSVFFSAKVFHSDAGLSGQRRVRHYGLGPAPSCRGHCRRDRQRWRYRWQRAVGRNGGGMSQGLKCAVPL